MAKFDLKKAILENKSTFFSSLTEGQFSWMTQDTGQQIGSQDENKIPVYMFDDKGKYYYENDYDGYGEFGGKDYYDLVAEMNGYTADDAEKFGGTFGELRGIGIKLAFGELEPKNGGPVLFPALVTKPDKFNYKSHNFAVEAETDPNQSWYEPEEDDDYIMGDEDDSNYGYNDEDDVMEGIDQPEEEGKGPSKTDLENQPETGLSEAYNDSLTPEEYELVKKSMADYYKVPEKNLDGSILDDYSTDNLKKLAPALNAKDLYSLMLKLKAAKMSAQIQLGTWEPESGLPSKDIVYPQGSKMDENKTTTKMKKSELKAKIKEMIVAEYERDVDYTDETAGYDFLAELENMLNEADETDTEKDTAETDTETTTDTTTDTETTDVTTTAEVDPNVKAVQDSLTQAQAAAQQLGDAKLLDQIGNTITFFTRTHVVEKPGAVAEGDKEYYKDAEADDAEHIKALEKDMKDDKKSSMNESMFPMLKKILK